MKTNYFKMMIGVVVVLLCAGATGGTDKDPGVRQSSGKIVSVDRNQGLLKLKGGVSKKIEDIIEYQIDHNAVLIMNTLDKKVLSIDDLQPGLHVTIDSIQSEEGRIAQTIVIVARPVNAPLNKKENLEQEGNDFNSKENKEARLKMPAEKNAAKALKEKQEGEEVQDEGEGQPKVSFKKGIVSTD